MKWMKLWAALAAGALLFVTVGCVPEKISGAEHYSKTYYTAKYGGDLDSNLSVFPDSVEGVQVNLFESSLGEGLFDTDGYIILDCSYTPARLADEVERLQSLTMTIRHYDGQTYTNKILYDGASYRYPAYVTNDGFGDTYEYALIDEAGGRIVYVYTAYISPKTFRYREYLKNDLTQYNKDEFKAFSMYNHTFDGGQSWDEFDDIVSASDTGK